MTHSLLLRTAIALLTSLSVLQAYCQDDPLYFTHDFEDKSIYPSSRTATEQTFNAPYGEWIYVNASSSTSSSYLRTGMGTRDLRMPKNIGSYVVLPLLDRGAKELSFMEGRGDRSITVYTSEDGGKTWTLHSTVTTDKTSYTNLVTINSMKVNRIKLANEGTADADVDNIQVSILAAGTKAPCGRATPRTSRRTGRRLKARLSMPETRRWLNGACAGAQKTACRQRPTTS